MNLDEMLKLFLDSRKRGVTGARAKCSEATLQFYTSRIGVFFEFLQTECEGIMRYEKIRRLHVVQFLDWMDKKDWSEAYRQGVLRSMKAFFRWVDKDEDCQESELKGLQKYLPAIPKTPQRTDIPQNVDVKKFRATYNLSNRWEHRDFVISSLILTNGVRRSEVCDLKVTDLHFEDKLMIVTGKGNKTRLVPLTAEMIRLLKGWIKRREKLKMAKDSEYLFVGKYSGKLDPDALSHRFLKHRQKHDLPRITPHAFRHSFCTNYLAEGGDIEKLRNITGHSSYEVLKTYLHVSKLGSKSLKDEVEKVNLLKKV